MFQFARIALAFRKMKAALLARDWAELKVLAVEAAALADLRPDAEVVVKLWDAIASRDWVAVARALSEFMLVVARILAVVLPLLAAADAGTAGEQAAVTAAAADCESIACACEAKLAA